ISEGKGEVGKRCKFGRIFQNVRKVEHECPERSLAVKVLQNSRSLDEFPVVEALLDITGSGRCCGKTKLAVTPSRCERGRCKLSIECCRIVCGIAVIGGRLFAVAGGSRCATRPVFRPGLAYRGRYATTQLAKMDESCVGFIEVLEGDPAGQEFGFREIDTFAQPVASGDLVSLFIKALRHCLASENLAFNPPAVGANHFV